MEGLARRLSDLWSGLFDALVRDNKVLPPVIALLALLLFAWVAAGAFLPDPDDERASGEAELVQSRDPAGAPAPGVEDRDADSYAAYRNKDPFRQLLAPADSASGDTPPSSASPPSGDASQDNPPEEADPGGASTPPDSTTGNNTGGAGGDSGTGDDGTGGAGGGQRSENDSDGDGLTNREEERLGQDPRDPDTDDDGTEDGADDSDGDDVPDGQGGDGGGAGDANGSDDELFDSGGSLRPR